MILENCFYSFALAESVFVDLSPSCQFKLKMNFTLLNWYMNYSQGWWHQDALGAKAQKQGRSLSTTRLLMTGMNNWNLMSTEESLVSTLLIFQTASQNSKLHQFGKKAGSRQ